MTTINISYTQKEIADNIRRERERCNYSQDYLAMRLGISQNAYSKIELGYTRIPIERLFLIAEILECDTVLLLKLQPVMV